MSSSFGCQHLKSHIVHKVRRWRRPKTVFVQYPCKLPIELWVLIFQFTEDGQTMTHVMCLNHAFRHMVETIRYRSVTLDDRSALLFFATLRSSCSSIPLHLEMLNLKHTPDLLSELALPSSWNTLINLRSLSLTVCACGGHESELTIGRALNQSRVLHLRAFRTNLDHAMIQLAPFFAAHPELTELDVASVPFSNYLIEDEGLDLNMCGAQLPSLRTLATPSVFLRAGLPIPSHLQHLHLSCDRPPLHFVANMLVGTQLLSLRLLALPLVTQASRSQLGLYEIRVMFPRLRFLQVDMILVSIFPGGFESIRIRAAHALCHRVIPCRLCPSSLSIGTRLGDRRMGIHRRPTPIVRSLGSGDFCRATCLCSRAAH
ncbi:hypothetical protein C8Q74DRAFT_383335 [Fomes fomentarius]|nr:hypothetical protein C8Q74DRAFT_383335 [Fomes fomentarius]